LMPKIPPALLPPLLLFTPMVKARTPPLPMRVDPSRTKSSCPTRPTLISQRT
jgi:hypothetical protein